MRPALTLIAPRLAFACRWAYFVFLVQLPKPTVTLALRQWSKFGTTDEAMGWNLQAMVRPSPILRTASVAPPVIARCTAE